MFIYFWERDSMNRGEAERERRRHRIWSRLQALSCQHRAQHGARTCELQHHDLSQSQTLHWLSHPGAPISSSIKWEIESCFLSLYIEFSLVKSSLPHQGFWILCVSLSHLSQQALGLPKFPSVIFFCVPTTHSIKLNLSCIPLVSRPVF